MSLAEVLCMITSFQTHSHLSFIAVILAASLLGACSASSGSTGGGGSSTSSNGGGSANDEGNDATNDAGAASATTGGDNGKPGDPCTCNGSSGSSGFCMNTGSGNGCSAGLECASYESSSPTCVTPCDPTASDPGAACASGAFCKEHDDGSSTLDLGDWCQ